MEAFLENPCGPLSKKTGGYIVVSVDLVFASVALIVHTIVLLTSTNYQEVIVFQGIFTGLELINVLLAFTLLVGLHRNNLGKCQTYMFGSVIMLLLGTIVFALYLIFNTKVSGPESIFEKICYPIYYLYKVYSLWVVKCFIVVIIRERMSHNNTSIVITNSRGSTKKQKYGISGSSSPNFPMIARSNRDSECFYEEVHGIDDIFHQIQFPREDQIPSENFRVGDELLKMQDDFYVKKGVLEVSKGNFVPVSVKIFKQKVEVEAVRAMLLEAKILTMFKNHPNVIQLLGFCTENIHKGKMILLLEFCSCGNLEDFLKDNYPIFKDQIREDEFRNSTQSNESEGIYENIPAVPRKDEFIFNSRTLVYMSFQIASGMEFITSQDIVHGNITAKNIIVDHHRVKIANFTFATQLHSFKKTNTPINFTKCQLPWKFMAIECMEVLNESNFTERSDVWSYGVTLWEIFSLGCVPYEGQSTSQFFPKLLQGERLEKPTFATSEIYQIMLDCWHHDPSQRPTFSHLKSTFAECLQNLRPK